jgi:hypothetical protein
MALTNTGKAFFTAIEILIDTNGTQDTIEESVLQEFGIFPAITAANLALLSETAVQERYDAFIVYLNNKYPGLDVETILTNEPIEDNLTLCPI